jgi:hypothetical protein
MIAPVLARNREKIFLASKSDARDYEGFKRDLERSLQAAGPGALRAGVAASGHSASDAIPGAFARLANRPQQYDQRTLLGSHPLFLADDRYPRVSPTRQSAPSVQRNLIRARFIN